ncbi:MAG: DUF992 domain-containing protein [Rhizobiaceae bacterium]|nr:DUF992 domain-containing protein [Rhizobiaceae bacterium]MCV0408463.1 DUF992 domain-containing protein [Rhizobiaceae bacterium]
MKRLILSTCAASLLALGTVAHAQDDDRVEVGILDCIIEGGTGFVFTSEKDLRCEFQGVEAGRPAEPYFGVVRKFGLDVGVTGEQVMRWAVFAPTDDPFGPGALAGDYVGATAEATAGVGAGANVLVGGSNQTITLQPVSLQAQTGLNLALGVTEFQLRTTVD